MLGLVVAFGIAGSALAWSPSLAVHSVSPTTAPPTGGRIVTITGRGFTSPVRVFFVMGDLRIESLVGTVWSDGSRLEIVTPPLLFAPDEQVRVASIEVESGDSRTTASDVFLFANEIQRPKVHTVTPNSGPKSGGTRLTIFGEGFQAPVQVLLGENEARILNVERNQIILEAPIASVTGPVAVLVRNVYSMTEATLDSAYRYVVDAAVHSVTPDHGPPGTRITIDGVGFLPPVAVNVAGVAAMPIIVTGTRIVAITQQVPTCTPFRGPVEVINIANGATASGPEFTNESNVPPAIVAVNPRTVVAGKTATVQLDAPGDFAFEIGGVPARVLSLVGSTYRLLVPENLPFARGGCTLRGIEGSGPVATRFDLRVIDRASGCANLRHDPILVSPAATASCTLPPLATVLPRSCSSRTVTIANERGRADLMISTSDAIAPQSALIRGGEKKEFTLTPGTQLERFKFATNDPKNPLLVVCVSP